MDTGTQAGPGTLFGGDDREAISYYLRLLWRRRTVLVACGAIGFGLGLAFASVQTPEYQASTMLRIDRATSTSTTTTTGRTHRPRDGRRFRAG